MHNKHKWTRKSTEGDTLGVRFFTAFCHHWHCTSLQPMHLRWFSHCFATIDNFCLVFLKWLNKTTIQQNKKTRNQKNTQKKWQDTTLCHWVCNLVVLFLYFFWVLFSHCTKTNNEPENKKPRNQKKTRLHTPRGGVVAESWVLSFYFFCFFNAFVAFFGFCFFWCLVFLVF